MMDYHYPDIYHHALQTSTDTIVQQLDWHDCSTEGWHDCSAEELILQQ